MSIDKFDYRIGDWIKDCSNIDRPNFGIVGAPFDGSTRGRPGARFAPRCIRDALYSMTTFINGVDICNRTIRDLGDIPTYYNSVSKNKAEIYRRVSQYLSICDKLIVLGGDHSITEPIFKAFAEEYKNVGLLVFDAHLDMREVKEDTVTSGTVIGDIIRNMRDRLDPRNVIYVGIRDFMNPKYYIKRAENLGVNIIGSIDILSGRVGINEIKEKISSILKRVDSLYISLDMDAIDQSYAPGVNAPSPLGLRPEHIVGIISAIDDIEKVRVLDITELVPFFDPTGNTCRIAATCITYFISTCIGKEETKNRNV